MSKKFQVNHASILVQRLLRLINDNYISQIRLMAKHHVWNLEVGSTTKVSHWLAKGDYRGI